MEVYTYMYMYPDPFLFTIYRHISFKWGEVSVWLSYWWKVSEALAKVLISLNLVSFLSVWLSWVERRVRDMLINDASDVSKILQAKCISYVGISVFARDMPCVLNTHCHVWVLFSFCEWHFIGSILWCWESLLLKYFIDQYEWPSGEAVGREEEEEKIYLGSWCFPHTKLIDLTRSEWDGSSWNNLGRKRL